MKTVNTATTATTATAATATVTATSKPVSKGKPTKAKQAKPDAMAHLQSLAADVVETNAATELGILEVFRQAHKINNLAAAKLIFQWVADINKAVGGSKSKATITHAVAVYAAHSVAGCTFWIGKGKTAEQLSIGKITADNCDKITLRSIDGEKQGFAAPKKEIDGKTVTWQPASYNRKPNGWNGASVTAGAYDVERAIKSMAAKANTKGFANDLLNPLSLSTAIAAGTDIDASEIKAAWLEVMLSELSLADIKKAKKQADELYGPQH